MSSPAVPSETSDKPTPRKFPPPCWTQEETLCLIEAYRDRWYALRRGYLRTADWDSVAASVTSKCPGVLPAKTSAQCRHKMEKLRQRHRAEKQRAISYPYPAGRYFSSWFFFENMEAMEKGTEVGAVGKEVVNNDNNSNSSGLKMKSFLDDSIIKLKLKAKSSEFDSGLGVDGFGGKGFRSSRGSGYSNSSMMMVEDDVGEEEEDFVNVRRGNNNYNGMNAGRIAIPMSCMRSNGKNAGRMMVNYSGGYSGGGGGDYNVSGSGTGNNSSEQFWGNNNGNMRSRSRGGVSSNGGGVKRGRDEVDDIASSIKMLTEGYVKMERAKMEMAREMEETRMEMELKRNEMLLESQKQIVDAFVKGLVGLKMANKKVKADVEAQLPETELGS